MAGMPQLDLGRNSHSGAAKPYRPQLILIESLQSASSGCLSQDVEL